MTEEEQRILQALDGMSVAALRARSIDELLQRLLEVFVHWTATVDTAMISLCEDDRLRVRAAVGLDDEVQGGFELAIGEGFEGTIAAQARPLFVQNASSDPLVRTPSVREKGVRALYGAPLLHDGRVLGVAQVGSLSADELSEADRRLFDALVSRAAVAIAHHLARQELDAERQRFLDLLNHLDHAVVWEADPRSLRFMFVSERAQVVTGFGPEVWLNDPEFWQHHVPAEDWPRLSALLDRCEESRSDGLCEHRFRRRDGREILVQTGVHCGAFEGGVRVQGVTIDVSPLRDALRARDDVLSVVSHDLRNPLAVITLNAAMIAGALQAEPSFVRQRRGAEVILRTVTRMARLIDDLVDIASIEAGNLSIRRSTEHPGEIIEEAVATLESAAAENGVLLRSETGAGLPQVICDRDRVIQVFTNILGNAVKVTPEGGAITVRAERTGGFVRFSVQDTGPGIAEHELDVIFDRFRRGRAGAYKGVGLGLAIAKGLVAAHGGEIWAHSKLGAGSTFHFTLPAEENPTAGA